MYFIVTNGTGSRPHHRAELKAIDHAQLGEKKVWVLEINSMEEFANLVHHFIMVEVKDSYYINPVDGSVMQVIILDNAANEVY